MSEKTIFAERFKSARLINGLSLQEVADAMSNQVTRQALHRYEKGEVIPDSEKINLFSKIFKVTPDYFFRNTKVELGRIEYRKLDNMPQKDIAVITEMTKEYLSRYLELEEILGFDNHFVNPLKEFSVVEYTDVNKAAEILRNTWNIGNGAIYNIVELLEEKNIKVLKLDVNESFDGLQTSVNNDTIPVVAYNIKKNNKPDRIRFTLLHELGHLLLKFSNTITEKQKEILCNQFAGAMLMPEDTIKRELGVHRSKISVLELANIKRQYGISMQAIVMRALDCKIINEHYTKQFFFMFKQLDWRIDEPYDYEGVEESNRLEQLLFRALAEGQISTSKAASLSNYSLSEFKKQYITF